MEEEEGKEVRNRFLEVQLRPPIAEASDVGGPGGQIEWKQVR